MQWLTPFIIYRIDQSGKLVPVYSASDLKQAKYWLTYIAQPGDVLCKTPAHPKHSKASETPEYWSHKEKSGMPASDEQAWKNFAAEKQCDLCFPQTTEVTTS